jgi:DNA polymerase-4
MIGHSRVLDMDARAPQAARAIARRLTVKAAGRLRHQDFHGASFMLSVRDCDYRGWKGLRRLPSPAQDNFTFLRALDSLWAEMLREFGPQRLKKVAVTFHDLCRREQITPDLFETADAARQQQGTRQMALSRTMDGLNRRYGSETVRLGPTPQTSAGYVGTKIAFSRVPDVSEFSQ